MIQPHNYQGTINSPESHTYYRTGTINSSESHTYQGTGTINSLEGYRGWGDSLLRLLCAVHRTVCIEPLCEAALPMLTSWILM